MLALAQTVAEQAVRRIESVWLGILLPAGIFVVSFVAAWLLYRHFARQVAETDKGQ